MKNTSIRLRPDQAQFIARVTKNKVTDTSDFVRQCVDLAAIVVAKQLPDKVKLPHGRRIVSLSKLERVRRRAGNGHTNGKRAQAR